jgi:phosphoglycerate dehydrogenase-like enzyme
MRPFVRDAVVAAGGVISHPAHAEGLVWVSPSHAADLRSLLDDNPQISWVQLPWAGIEPFVGVLDSDRLWTAGQGVYAEPVAEHALALALAGLRDLKTRAVATSWGKPSGLSLVGGRVTILGAGGIARELARLLEPFKVRLTIVRNKAQEFPGAERTLTHLSDALDCDVLVVAAALTAKTRHCIGAEELARMHKHAWIVNVARGGLIDTDALVHALEQHLIGGAALDVTEPEPLPPDHPLWKSPRCLITPHVGNTPEMAVPLLSARVTENVRRRIEGRELLGVVDVKEGY